MRTHIPQALAEDIALEHANGFSAERIAQNLRCTKESVHVVLMQMGIDDEGIRERGRINRTGIADEGAYCPSEDEIRAHCLAFQRNWSELERRRRRGIIDAPMDYRALGYSLRPDRFGALGFDPIYLPEF